MKRFADLGELQIKSVESVINTFDYSSKTQ